ncbi:molybdopterin-dependent oxidoreductase [Sphingopyxis flava]|uniref:Oxidoreductase molybdopterin-binding domain-containing protein n=1 Tax=Sphingopyxis flava TaxID=1507287 RepID=A0A1T5FBD1_9SPHN|nr:molybdopterin-dependent oxidoreductase [Sphingopyxis flava]SKB93460.1 hypothetical protein SAMN06295937_10322 [Sphingopyxis flava]
MYRVLLLVILVLTGGTVTACDPVSEGNTELFELSQPAGDIVLEVSGAIAVRNGENGAQFDMAMLRGLPTVSLSTGTSVTDGSSDFEGFLLRDFLSGLGATGTIVRASALNDYVVDIPMSDIERFDVIVAHSMDGEPLSLQDKGPLWIVYPRDAHPELQDIRYDYRWVWQLNALEVQ